MLQLTISCPNCKWEPQGEKDWNCHNCGKEIDMFANLSRCSHCGHQHNMVVCVSFKGGCDQYFPITEWYSGLDEGLAEIDVFRRIDPG